MTAVDELTQLPASWNLHLQLDELDAGALLQLTGPMGAVTRTVTALVARVLPTLDELRRREDHRPISPAGGETR